MKLLYVQINYLYTHVYINIYVCMYTPYMLVYNILFIYIYVSKKLLIERHPGSFVFFFSIFLESPLTLDVVEHILN